MADLLKALELEPGLQEASDRVKELRDLMAKEAKLKKDQAKKKPAAKRPPKTRSVKLETVVPEDRSSVFGPK